MSALKAASRRAPPGLAALILAIAATVIAGCGVATPPVTGTSPAAAGPPAAGAATPPVFAGTLVPAGPCRPGHHRGADSCLAWPVGLFSSATGRLIRLLTRPPAGVSDQVLSVRGGWVYFVAWRAGAPPGVWRVPLAGGQARLVQAGTAGYALSPDDRMTASVVTVNHRHASQATQIVVTNLVTGHRRTVVMVASQPVVGSHIGVTNLTWAPDDTHLAVEVQHAAFARDVVVSDARTARTIADGRQAPCPGACAAKFSAYLRTGALAYLTEQLLPAGEAITLVRWARGHRADRLASIWTGRAEAPLVDGESTTPQGAAIWALQSQTGYVIWRRAGGTPVRIRALLPPGYHALWGIAW
jgi:hypothetical protein